MPTPSPATAHQTDPPHAVRALLLDLDDTLIDDRKAMAAAVLLLRAQLGLAPSEDNDGVAARWDSIGRALWGRCAAGEISFAEQRRVRLRETFGIALADREADALFDEYLRFYALHWELFPGATEFLAATAHLPRVLVTNGHRAQVNKKLQTLGLAGHFQFVVTPDDCGAKKPDPRIFLRALELLGVAPQHAMMLGDNAVSDIAPAAALGMQVFHVDHRVQGQSIADGIRHAVASHY
ncbi:HAD family hydrolase [Rhodoferax sp. AJA081-3]|uniref:HAD family hydrolase n=1 Tax=Rhodoferax sp. AJA081-3 TaxID=2752316 RepID=UPI001AE02EFA|nr:HAD family hydrolase [Rhodoferax sp. AJA081-3]QTN29557.1 HAD family hydrolase [Rhodoferax sp. AJA081-3]